MKRLLLVALMVLVSLVGMVGFSRAQTLSAISNAASALQATVNTGVPVQAKMYYLTKNSFDGGDAIKACDSGFHMARISEIQDPSNLQYATRGTAAYDALVDGEGFEPPSDHMGWVRSGSFPLVEVPDYCDFSMSSFEQQSGTTMSRRTLWDHPSTELQASAAPSWWYTTQESSSQPESVWCVENPD